MTRPDFSPAMLSAFLRARAAVAHLDRPSRCGPGATARRERARWKRISGLTHLEIDFAWMGRLSRAAPRAALWAALGHFPADCGILLTDDGGQDAADAAPPDAFRNTPRGGSGTAREASSTGSGPADRRRVGAQPGRPNRSIAAAAGGRHG